MPGLLRMMTVIFGSRSCGARGTLFSLAKRSSVDQSAQRMRRRSEKLLLVAGVAALIFAELTGAATTSGAAAQFLNISTRGFVQTGDGALIGGFILGGSVAKRVLLRGIGPSLGEAGLSDVLADPALELRDQNGSPVLANDDWRDAQDAEIEATGLAPNDNREAAIVAELLSPGPYTAILRGLSNGTGIGLIEVYDLTPNSGSLLANISTRGFVDAGDRSMIGGFIVGGGSDGARIIARGIGPSLAAADVTDSLADPTLELRSSDGVVVAANDNWKETQQSAIEATGVAPGDDLESAIVAELPAGDYTAILRGHADGVGTALVEFYALNAPPGPAATFSFESGLEGWAPTATDIKNPPVYWSIEQSQDRATEGSSSLKFALDNLNDAGKIWIERAFSVRPNQQYHLRVQFSFATADWGDVNHWTITAGVRTQPAQTRSDLTYQGSTANGEGGDTGYKWLEKSYDLDVISAADGTLYVDIGVAGTWETFRAYYVDHVRVTITER